MSRMSEKTWCLMVWLVLASNLWCGLATAGDGFIWGVAAHALSRADNLQHLQLMQALGIKSFRDDANWNAVERSPGQYTFRPAWDRLIDAAGARGISPLLIIDYGNRLYGKGAKPIAESGRTPYVAYAKALVQHYKGKVHLYEIWNEWDIREPKSAAAYVELLRATYPAIKAVDPDAIVLAGGIGPYSIREVPLSESWFDEFVEAGGLNYLDGLSVHPYVHCERQPTPDGYLRLLQQMSANASSRRGLPIYITEMGWPTHHGACGVPKAKVRTYILDVFLIAKCLPQVKGLWWYDLINDGRNTANREHNFGIYDADLQPTEAQKSAALIGRMNSQISCERPIDRRKEEARYRVTGVGSFSYKGISEWLGAQL